MLGMDLKAKAWVTAAALLVSVFMAGVLSAAAFIQLASPGIEALDREDRRDGRDGRDRRPPRRPGPRDGFFGGPPGAPGTDRHEFFLDLLTERLDLDDVQREQIAEILIERNQMADEVMVSIRERLRAIMDSLESEVSEVLTDEQREAFEEMQRDGRDRLGRMFPGAGGPPDRGRPPPD